MLSIPHEKVRISLSVSRNNLASNLSVLFVPREIDDEAEQCSPDTALAIIHRWIWAMEKRADERGEPAFRSVNFFENLQIGNLEIGMSESAHGASDKSIAVKYVELQNGVADGVGFNAIPAALIVRKRLNVATDAGVIFSADCFPVRGLMVCS